LSIKNWVSFRAFPKLLGYVCEWNEIWKWNGIAADLIDIREKKVIMFYIKK
jgi:hypothetical protein